MFVSVFELFKVGIGPSSSHTVGPMRAARRFVERVIEAGYIDQVSRVKVRLHGSLAHTGRGHGTDVALMLGLEGESPDLVDVDLVEQRVEYIKSQRCLQLTPTYQISFSYDRDIIFDKRNDAASRPGPAKSCAIHAVDRL